MALTYLEGVNRMLSALGEDQVGSLLSGGSVASNRCKIYINDVWSMLVVDSGWLWTGLTVPVTSTGIPTAPDIFNASGLQEISSLNITYDNTSTITQLPVTDDVCQLIGVTSITEEALWTPGAAITSGAIRGYAKNIYTAASSGTTGSTPPTHTSGTVTDGGVNWRFTNTFALQATPYSWSIISNSQIRMRPYPGPLGLQRYTVTGDMAPTRLVNDTDVFPQLPVEFEPALIDMALEKAALKHLDDIDAANRYRMSYTDLLNNLRNTNRKKLGPKRVRMMNNGIML